MKKLLNLALMTLTISATTYSTKSEAGIVLIGASIAVAKSARCIPNPGHNPNTAGCLSWLAIAGIPTIAGVAGVIAGPILLATGNIPVGIVFLVLDENGSLSQDELETALSERFPFISDREVILELASSINAKAETMQLDAEGKKMVSLSREEILSILTPTDLTQEEKNIIITNLK